MMYMMYRHKIEMKLENKKIFFFNIWAKLKNYSIKTLWFNLPQDEVSQYPDAHVHLLLVELQVSPIFALHMYVWLHAIP